MAGRWQGGRGSAQLYEIVCSSTSPRLGRGKMKKNEEITTLLLEAGVVEIYSNLPLL